MDNLTIKSLNKLLNNLINKGAGDYEIKTVDMIGIKHDIKEKVYLDEEKKILYLHIEYW